MTYEETAALMVDQDFRGRAKVACLHFAAYIIPEDPATPAHNTRYRWAQNTLAQPDTAAAAVMPTLVMEPSVQSEGAQISDTDLQTATETALQKIM